MNYAQAMSWLRVTLTIYPSLPTSQAGEPSTSKKRILPHDVFFFIILALVVYI